MDPVLEMDRSQLHSIQEILLPTAQICQRSLLKHKMMFWRVLRSSHVQVTQPLTVQQRTQELSAYLGQQANSFELAL